VIVTHRLEVIFRNISDWFNNLNQKSQKEDSYLLEFENLINTLNEFNKWLSFLLAHFEQSQLFLSGNLDNKDELIFRI
jgi:hypothetical protein